MKVASALLRHSIKPYRPSVLITFQTTRYFSLTGRKMDYSNIKTPEACYVDFCLVPVGTGDASVANEVAEVQKLLKASGLKYTMHSAGTTVEGTWDQVMKVIGQCHSLVHQKYGAKRVQTSMRAGTRTDKKQTAEQKVKRVEDILASGH
ncbi:hypothetical protein QBC46DRAFT_378625 [Diplogelasinospora grovesii]|uniref:Thiamine-binding protein domain-containing protein n=1 Tax=Diplogelasinospora grovesii TaxID=303347 RepID=A0AAN6S7J9_9PEZI|nr:hypothetical protein QBC46DRAFT_378625 [Diplogelasinospora grovesii]